MPEYASVSSSAYDTAALVTKLNEKGADGWDVVAIVPTGGDITAFLKRDGSSSTDSGTDVPAAAVVYDGAASTTAEAEPEPEPVATPEPVTEPAGWGAVPETAAAAAVAAPAEVAPIDPAPSPAPAPAPAPVAAPAPVVTTPAGWYPDPSGRYEMRYWDGEKWTEHVSRQGATYTDPPVA